MRVHYLTVDQVKISKPGASVSIVVIAVVTCAVFVTLVTVVLVVVIIVLKKKYDNKQEEPTSTTEPGYEPVLPSSIPLTSVSYGKKVGESVEDSKEQDVTYDEIASVHSQAITLRKNDAYECTSFKPSDEPATDEL